MHSQRKYSPHTIIFGIALVLFCLVIISTYMMSGMYARYRAADDATDQARVATFSVDADWGDDFTIDATKTAEGTYTISLTNHSEVAVRCDLVLTLDENVLNALDIALDGNAGTRVGNTVTFQNIHSFDPDDTSSSHTLEFTVSDLGFFMQDATEQAYSKSFSFDAKVTCTQID